MTLLDLFFYILDFFLYKTNAIEKNIITQQILISCSKYKLGTSIYDFGFIYKTPIKIKWILDELLIEKLENFEFKYMASYFDEEDEIDLVDNYIKSNDENDLLISNITNKLFRNY